MKFISHADFGLPLDGFSYLAKHLFILDNTGSLSLDGNLRFFVRLFQYLSLYLTNNVIASYIYIFMVFLISFFSFYIFAKNFLNIEDRAAIFFSSLFFAINPIFLGNVSKIGLTLAASFLPLILTSIKYFFIRKKQPYLILAGIFLLFSLIHPFNFVVNLFISLTYFIFIFIRSNSKKEIIHRMVLPILALVLLFAHILLLFFSMGFDLTKADIETTIGSSTSSNYLPFANTKSLLASFMLDKPVFIDYPLYSPSFYYFYLIGVISLLSISLIPLFEKNLKENYLSVSYVLLGVLFILSAVNFKFISLIIEYISTSFFFGWIFRSPLKWQLYIPFCLATILSNSFSILLNDRIKRRKILFIMVILVILALPNIYVSKGVYSNLLVPKEVRYLDPDLFEKLSGESLLIIKNKELSDLTREDEEFSKELSLMLNTKNIRYGYLEFNREEEYSLINWSSFFNYILSYSKLEKELCLDLKIEEVFDNGFVLYSTPKRTSQISSSATYFSKINPVKYRIYLKDLRDPKNISLNTLTNSNWKLYLVRNPSIKGCNPNNINMKIDTIECEYAPKLFEGEELSYLWREPIFENTHTGVYNYANQWTINPNHIKNNFSKGHYIENKDGSIDIELVLYFKPQSYFYMGLLISGTTLVACLSYLIYGWKKNKHKN